MLVKTSHVEPPPLAVLIAGLYDRSFMMLSFRYTVIIGFFLFLYFRFYLCFGRTRAISDFGKIGRR